MRRVDVAIVGAGMAGASLAAELAPRASVLLIEAEARPGVHATGRSAAFWAESYGGPGVQPLTTASHAMLDRPPPAFSERGFLRRRGAIHLTRNASAIADLAAAFADGDVRLDPLDTAGIAARVPGLTGTGWHALHEPSTSDIDVAALHAAYLRAAHRAGAVLECEAPLRGAKRRGGAWHLDIGEPAVADILVDAAGAWADPVAEACGVRPLGIRPYRRTVAQLRVVPPPPVDMPLVIDAGGGFYFKPEPGGRLWLSPHDETPAPAGDAAAEEMDVAIAIDRLQAVVDWRVEAVERRWAGLRSFAPDRLPVYGFDGAAPGFFWFAGQGGFGIQTAPAAARLGAAAVLNAAPHESVAAIDPTIYAPGRFRVS